MEIVISLLALLIAVAEFWMLILEHRKINREKKEQEEKERLIATFAEQTSKINIATKTIVSAINTFQGYVKNPSDDAGEMLNGIISKGKKVVETSSQAYNSIFSLYKAMLKHESDFPLSKGFDRMINACRNFCYNSRAVITECRERVEILNTRYHEIYSCVNKNGESFSLEYRLELGKLTDDLQNTILKLYPLVVELAPYIFELNTKYDIQSDMDKQ